MQLTSENVHNYKESLIALFLEHDYNYDEVIDFAYENYIYVNNNVVIAYALIKKSDVIYDIKNKYINKKKYNYNNKKFCNDFSIASIECLYNLVRLRDSKYVGYGMLFIKDILAFKKVINLATTEDKLYKYYCAMGFKSTNYFDMDIYGTYRKVLCLI